MDQQTVTLIVAGLGIGGTLGGIVVGHFLTRSWQQKQYRQDNVNTESRELLTSLMTVFPAYTKWVRGWASLFPSDLTDGERVRGYSKVTGEFNRVLNDRLFIAKDVKRLEIKKRWDAACVEYDKTTPVDETRMKEHVDAIIADIVEMALNKKPPLWKRAWDRIKRRFKRA